MTLRPQDFAERFFFENAASYDHIARISTLGLDGWWKRKLLKRLPQAPQRILEQASGTGILTFKIARRFPNCRITAVELNEAYLNLARQKIRDLGLRNVEFIHGRAEDVVVPGEFDCIVSDYLAKYVDLDRLVTHAATMLRQGGILIMHELTRPTHPLLLPLWNLHFSFLRAYGTWKHPEWSPAFNDVQSLLKETRWVEDLVRALAARGFSAIKVETQFLGASVIVSARK
ncbi:MAG TPA: class I SAM-dependent methyltransferase [Hyphomicrobiaceae bacterium]|nr:class I SAM-dependent methyltransferase [Hyphomicrobiaceae bacterium]